MSWKSTSLLLTIAAVVFAFIYFVERRLRPTSLGNEPPPRLVTFRPLEVTNVVLRRTNQLVLRAERGQDQWELAFPWSYPAQGVAIERLLASVGNLASQAYFSPQDLASQRRTIAEYGLDVPQATILLQHGGRRTELLLGARTALGDQVYAQLFEAPGIHVISADILNLLPPDAESWRDTALVNLKGLNIERIEARAPLRGFAIEANPTNKLLYLSKPTVARASVEKLQLLLRKVQTAQVARFVNDDPHADLEPYGLKPPTAELLFSEGSNDLVVVQFGKTYEQDPTLVYARRMAHTNIVLAPKTALEAALTSHAELRDLHLLSFAPSTIDALEVIGPESFSVRRQTNGQWLIVEPNTPADPELMSDWINHLARLQGTVEKDVVTDFAPYGLAPPARRYLLKNTVSNASGQPTNQVAAHLEVGPPREGKIFARGIDESVYAITPADYAALPAAAWQLRDRRVWVFSSNQVARVEFHLQGQVRQLLRGANGDWSFAPGSQGIMTPDKLEKLMGQLGDLRAVAWVGRGEENRGSFGFKADREKLALDKLVIELKGGERPRALTVEFGGRSPLQVPYALVTLEGQTWIFEFPLNLFYELAHFASNLFLPARASAR